MQHGWIFPYEAVKKDSQIVIYGAGEMGKSFVSQINWTGYCQLVLWIDKKSTKYQKEGLDVKSIEHIKKEQNIDKILIAINSLDVCSEVIEYLKSYGIEIEKIWTPFLDSKISDKNDIKRFFHNFAGNNFDTLRDRKQRIDLCKLDIAFVVPAPVRGGGGHRNIFRVVKYLSEKGHRVTVYYVQTDENADEVKEHVSSWFYNMEHVSFIRFEGIFNHHDIGIATWWETAYILDARKNNFCRLFYFVQDYEAYFYPMSSDYLLAENSYNLGMFHICSGPWCKEKIEKKYNAQAVYFQFPVDKEIYHTRKRTKINKNIVFFAKPDMARRCYEIGVRALEAFHQLRPEIEIIMFGSKNLLKDEVPFEATIRNIVPTLEELAEIYANADLGIAFSTTNPSLVPYEMMCSGCPVVDLDVDHAIQKYGGDESNVFLLPIDAMTFAHKLSEIIDDKETLQCHAEKGREWVETEFPSELEMQKFVEQTIITEVLRFLRE